MSPPVMSSFERPIHALVVGASRGIGLEICRQLTASPNVARVVAAARKPQESAGLGALLGARGSDGRITTVKLDVVDETSVEVAAVEVGRRVERLDLIFSCAGVLHDDGLEPERRLADVSPAALERSFRTNAFGPLLIAKHFCSFIPRETRAVFASISARVGSIGDNRLGGWYAYRASKAAQNMIIKSLSIEFARRSPKLVCVALHPGTVDTDLSRPFQRSVSADRLFSVDRAASQLLDVVDTLTPESSGGFFAWDGSRIPW